MATMIQAYQTYRPRIQRGIPADLEEVARFIALSTGLDHWQIHMVLGKLHDAIIHYARQGRGVKLKEIISLWPTMNCKGVFSLGQRLNPRLLAALNHAVRFKAPIKHFERLFWSKADYRAAWNAEHPDDPIED